MMQPDPGDRLVVRPPNWLGDAILALPAIAAIRRAYPETQLTIAASAAVAALFREETPAEADHVIELSADTSAAVAALEAGRFTAGVLFPNSFRSAWQFRRAAIPGRWGYATSARGWLLTQRARRRPPDAGQHQADYYVDLVRGLGIPCESGEPPRVAPRAPTVARAQALLAQHGVPDHAPFIGFAPGAAYGRAKQWPPERVAAVIALLAREYDLRSVIVGATHDRDAAREIESWLRAHAPEARAHVVNLVGRTSLGALVGVAARASAFVSNDSGVMHLAAAVGRPVVAIFGPTDERATHPIGAHEIVTEPVFCRPCLLRDCPIDHRCMKRISVDRVLGAVLSAFDAARVA